MQSDEDRSSPIDLPPCRNCGQEHEPWTNSTRAASLSLSSSDLKIKEEIFARIHRVNVLTEHDVWNNGILDEIEEAVEYLSKHIDSVSHDLFPAKSDGEIKAVIKKLDNVYDALDEDEESGETLEQQIYALKLLHCKVYSRDDGELLEVNDLAEKLQDVNESKLEVDHVIENVDCKQDHKIRPGNIATAKKFDGRYHYRRANKCVRCATVKSMDKDCFFSLDFKAIGNALDKCTSCKRTGYRCQSTGDDSADDSVAAGFHKAEGPDQMQIPAPAAFVPLPTASTSTMQVALSPATTTAAGPSVSLLRKRATVPVVTPTSFSAMPKESGKRQAVSAPSGSNPVGTRGLKFGRFHESSQPPATQKPDAGIASSNRLVDKATLLRQVSRLNTSFESFTDVSLRQIESNRTRSEQEAAIQEYKLVYQEHKRLREERKRAYKESMRAYKESVRDFEESRRTFKEKEQLCEESEPVYAATQEWLAARSASAGEDIIKEATSLLSSINQGPALRDIMPALQRLRAVFADFQRVQGELSEVHKFKGVRAQYLYTLMERIQKVIDRAVLAEDEESMGAKGLNIYTTLALTT